MYEWETDFLEVPVPPSASRDPPEPPDLWASSRDSDRRDGVSPYGNYSGAYGYAQHEKDPGPSLMGAFTALVHRAPQHTESDSESRDPVRNSRGERRPSREIAVSDVRHIPSDRSGADAAGPNLEEQDVEEQAGPVNWPAPGSNAVPPTQQSGPGWSFASGWGRLFGGGADSRDDSRIREEDPEDVPSPTYARYVDPSLEAQRQQQMREQMQREPSMQHEQSRGSDPYQERVSARSRDSNASGRIDLVNEPEAVPARSGWSSWMQPSAYSERSGGSDLADRHLDPSEDDDHHSLVTAIVFRAVDKYTHKFAGRCPCFCASCYLLIFIIVIVVGMILMPVNVETNFDAFMKTDVNSSVLQDTFGASIQERMEDSRRLQEDGRRLQFEGGALLYMQYDVYIGYELKDSSGKTSILDSEVLTEIQKFEQNLLGSDQWKRKCETVEESELQRLCMPGLSLINYVRPTLDMTPGNIVPTDMNFDGQGRDSVPLQTALNMIHNHGLQKIMLPNSFELTADTSGVTMLRSCFRFKFYCCTSMEPLSKQKRIVNKAKEEWKDFVKTDLIPLLNADVEVEGEDSPVNIFYGGNAFTSIEVLDTLMGDIWLAMGSMCFVFVYLMFHTQSIFLSVIGLIVIILSVPLAYVIFAAVSGTNTLSIASFLSLFLVVGLGSDVVFVYTDFWRDSQNRKDSVPAQLAWTTMYAGKASLATTATTALSFFANLASTLRPLREFGVFMGLCVVLVWVLVTLVYVPFCVIDTYVCGCCSLRRCNPFKEKNNSDGLSSWQRIFAGLTGVIFRIRRSCLLLFLALYVMSIVLAAMNAETDSGVPNIFPEDHNQNRGKKVLEKFASPQEVLDPLFAAPPMREMVCNEYDFRPEDKHACQIFWCEVQAGVYWKEDAGQCQCWRKETPECPGSTAILAAQRIIGTEINQADLEGSVADYLVSPSSTGISFPAGLPSRATMMQASQMAPILLQEWESGDTMLVPMTQVRTTLMRDAANAHSTCDYQELCFCGTYVCALPEPWRRSGVINLGISRANYGGRSLQQLNSPIIPADQRTSVNVIFGIKVEDTSPLLGEPDLSARWSFYKSFEASQPWAQRNLYKFCSQMPLSLRVVERRCWIEDFRFWLLNRKERFPAPSTRFDELVGEFVQYGLTGLLSSKDFLWMRDNKVMACFMTFSVNIKKYAQTEKAIAFMKTWDQEIQIYNDEASRYARGAWHTSNLWVRAEAQEALVSSTLMTLIIVITLAFVGMFVFTMDFMLSLFVILATVGVLCNLAFFICVVMAWPIGPIEVIALIVFIGYAVTYSLHFAHLYGSGEALKEPLRLELGVRAQVRYQRTVFALKAIGSAALGSACTTMGCSFFLLFCTLSIFQKLGGVVLAVTVMSIVTALVPLPALLLLIGPLEPGRRCGFPGIFNCCQDIYDRATSIIDRTSAIASWLTGRGTYGDDFLETDKKPPLGFTHGTAGGGIRVMQPVAQPAGMRPSTSENQLQPPQIDSWDAVERHQPQTASPRAQQSPRGQSPQGQPHQASPRAHALVNSTLPPQPVMVPDKPRSVVQSSAASGVQPVMQVDDVLLSEAFFDSKPFDIGTESPLEPIWSREIEQTSGRVRAIHEKSPRRAGGTPRTSRDMSASPRNREVPPNSRVSPRDHMASRPSPRDQMASQEPIRASPRTRVARPDPPQSTQPAPRNRVARPEPPQPVPPSPRTRARSASPSIHAPSSDGRAFSTAPRAVSPRAASPRGAPMYVS